MPRAATEATTRLQPSPHLLILLRFQGCCSCAHPVNENHPVVHALRQQLASLRQQYRNQPDEHTRYRLVRHEQLIAQWVPASQLSSLSV